MTLLVDSRVRCHWPSSTLRGQGFCAAAILRTLARHAGAVARLPILDSLGDAGAVYPGVACGCCTRTLGLHRALLVEDAFGTAVRSNCVLSRGNGRHPWHEPAIGEMPCGPTLRQPQRRASDPPLACVAWPRPARGWLLPRFRWPTNVHLFRAGTSDPASGSRACPALRRCAAGSRRPSRHGSRTAAWRNSSGMHAP